MRKATAGSERNRCPFDARPGASVHVGRVTTERSKREQLVETNRTGIEDRVWRALGMLERARTLSLDEAMSGLSAVRLGINLGLVDAVPLKLINELFIVAQPAHLQKAIGEELPESEHDRRRAELVRTRLAAGT